MAAIGAAKRGPYAEALLGEVEADARILAEAIKVTPDDVTHINAALHDEILDKPAEVVLRQRGDDGGTLYLRLRGARAAVHSASLRLGGERLDNDTDRDAIAADWSASRDLSLPWFKNRAADHCLWRLSVPATTPPLALPPITFLESLPVSARRDEIAEMKTGVEPVDPKSVGVEEVKRSEV